MRSTQFFGLRPEAVQWLLANCKKDHFETYKNNQLVNDWFEPQVQTDPENIIRGMFDEPILLKIFESKEGHEIKEKLLTTLWSSGPMIFTKLVDQNGRDILESVWTDSEIEDHS